MHGSNLIKAIRQRDASSEIRCWGGDKMEAAGATLVKHISELAFMGFVAVLKNALPEASTPIAPFAASI